MRSESNQVPPPGGDTTDKKPDLSRRDFVRAGLITLVGTAGAAGAAAASQTGERAHAGHSSRPHLMGGMGDVMPNTVGEVDHERNRFNPSDILTDFDWGDEVSTENGRTVRTWNVVATDKLFEVAPGIEFNGWAYNDRIPGPTLRANEGDRLRINFTNGSPHPHSMHFHGIHPSEMDGVPGTGPGLIQPGDSFTYEFDALPFGLHLYHCHAFPLARHIAKGLYGAFIIDPPGGRPPVDHEFVMIMNGFDVDFDDANDFYAVNTIPFHFQNHPIQFRVNETVRLYLVNILEFDLINSFHIHANFFNYYPTGTSLTPTEYTDTIIQGQAQRGILEFSYRYPGIYMFHAHVTEFAELGWAGHFEVLP